MREQTPHFSHLHCAFSTFLCPSELPLCPPPPQDLSLWCCPGGDLLCTVGFQEKRKSHHAPVQGSGASHILGDPFALSVHMTHRKSIAASRSLNNLEAGDSGQPGLPVFSWEAWTGGLSEPQFLLLEQGIAGLGGVPDGNMFCTAPLRKVITVTSWSKISFKFANTPFHVQKHGDVFFFISGTDGVYLFIFRREQVSGWWISYLLRWTVWKLGSRFSFWRPPTGQVRKRLSNLQHLKTVGFTYSLVMEDYV